MSLPVSELIVRYLARLGIDHIFGMPGAHILPVYDRLRDSGIRSILVKHEQGGAFMAGGYARVTHRPAACIATAGPGATNLLTGIANAYAERLPVLAITGETSTYLFGKGGLQESAGEGGAIEQTALFAGVTRYRKLIERTDYLAQVLNQATQALLGGEPGPVLLSIPYNVQKESVDPGVLDQLHFPAPTAASPVSQVAALVNLLRNARTPVIIAGHGCMRSGAQRAVARLATRFNIPVTTSLKAKGVVDEDSPLALGCLGVTSNGEAYRYLVDHADLLICLGAGFNERTSHVWDPALLANKKLVQVDRDGQQIGRVFQPDLAICGDILELVDAVASALDADPMPPKDSAALQQHRGARAEDARAPEAEAETETEADATPFALIRDFYRQLATRFPAGTRVFDDNIVFAQSYFGVSERNQYFPNTGISSLGYALPAAIGAQCAAPGGPTFAVMGDGGFQMCCMEMMTAVNYAIPLNVVVINNGTLSLIRKNQFQLYEGRYTDCDFINPDFGLLAQSFGVRHFRIATPQDLDTLFETADLTGAINLIEIMLDKHAFPRYLSAR